MLEDLEISKERKSLFQDARRLVVKLGTRVVTVGDHALNRSLIDRLAKDVAEVRSHGIQVAIVSSGAVGSGMGRLGLRTRPRRIPELQATAAVGQGLLMNAYKQAFREHSVPVGQVLLTSEDLDNRQRYVNARNTLDALFRLGAVPVVNENDSVAVEELELSVGDNDRLSALVAHLIDADLLVILTDVDGLHTEDPTRNGNATLIRRVEATTDDLAANAGGARSGLGLGGMRSKILAARSATQGGRPTIIANGHKVGLAELFAGVEAGTLFAAEARELTDRKLWIANTRRRGAVVVDDGAVEALWQRGKSLLPSGVLEVVGDFDAGELIGVEDLGRREFARGLARYAASEIRKILGRKTSEAASILGRRDGTEVIHRDDLVLL